MVAVKSAVTMFDSSKSGSASGRLEVHVSAIDDRIHEKYARLPSTFQVPKIGSATGLAASIWVTYDLCDVATTS